MVSVLCGCLLCFSSVFAAQLLPHIVAADLKGGYQVVAADVNHDGKIDLIALGAGQSDLVWYENPTWQRHVIATGMNHMINLAYWNDRIAVASDFSNEAKASVGTVSLMSPQGNVRQPWTIREIDHLTTSHRLRWADIEGNGRKVLVNAPLTSARAAAPDYRDHVPLVLYRPGEWKREVISEANDGVQHGIFIVDWDQQGRDAILTASFSGIALYRFEQNSGWRREQIAAGRGAPCPQCGSSDVTVGRLGEERFLAAIEPWHGNEVAVYHRHADGWVRTLLDDTLSEGHTIVTIDIDSDGDDQIVAGFRGHGGSVLLYKAGRDGAWSRSVIDSSLAANACTVADLNGDGHPDLACIGGSVLKWYENSQSIKH